MSSLNPVQSNTPQEEPVFFRQATQVLKNCNARCSSIWKSIVKGDEENLKITETQAQKKDSQKEWNCIKIIQAHCESAIFEVFCHSAVLVAAYLGLKSIFGISFPYETLVICAVVGLHAIDRLSSAETTKNVVNDVAPPMNAGQRKPEGKEEPPTKRPIPKQRRPQVSPPKTRKQSFSFLYNPEPTIKSKR